MAMFDWSSRSDVDLQFIQPDKPSQNGCLRNECLNESPFSTLREAQEVVETCRKA